jgi:hypothetical protein
VYAPCHQKHTSRIHGGGFPTHGAFCKHFPLVGKFALFWLNPCIHNDLPGVNSAERNRGSLVAKRRYHPNLDLGSHSMYVKNAKLLALTLLLVSIVPATADVSPNDGLARVAVVFRNGRRAPAAIDPRTDLNRLWLQFGRNGARITRSFSWDEVTLYQPNGQALSRDDAFELARAAAKRSTDLTTSNTTRTVKLNSNPVHDVYRSPREDSADSRARFIRFDAMISNWDNDVEMDGLMVQVVPSTATGLQTTIRGQLNVELWSMRRIEQDSAPHLRGRALEILQRWSVPIVVAATDSPVWLKLPFQTRHPEFDFNWSPIGLVHVELVAPGHGVFHHSIDGVRIRPYAPFRDALQVQTRERFLPTELNGPK